MTRAKNIYLLLGLAAVVVAVFWARLVGPAGPVPGDHAPDAASNSQRSPNGSAEAQLRFNKGQVPELWIVPLRSVRRRIKVSRLQPGEAVDANFAWSTKGTLLAFETYNAEGHSPMTTSHVWVVRADGSGLREVILPSPNERRSTHIDRWTDDDSLRVLSTPLESERGTAFTFVYSKQEIQEDRSQ